MATKASVPLKRLVMAAFLAAVLAGGVAGLFAPPVTASAGCCGVGECKFVSDDMCYGTEDCYGYDCCAC